MKNAGYLENTISALCHELAAAHSGPACEPISPYGEIVDFVLGQMKRMPPFLRWAINVGTAIFGASRLLRERAFFHRRESHRRRLQVHIWQQSRLGPCHDLMKFYSSLVVLALYSRPDADRSREALS